VLQGDDNAKPLYNVQVKDACWGTTAAPIFFPPANFQEVPGAENRRDRPRVFNVIDGGIAVNDPVGFSSSHFLQFVLPMNIQKLLL
jgi:patatin-like phospholipase/acyl hydrolase